MISITMWIVTLRRAASARIRSSWCSAPSTRTTQVRRRAGSRASAWLNVAAMTSAGSCSTEPASHLALALGLGRMARLPCRPPGGAMTSCGRLGAGSAS
jgi:hypothetical protein